MIATSEEYRVPPGGRRKGGQRDPRWNRPSGVVVVVCVPGG